MITVQECVSRGGCSEVIMPGEVKHVHVVGEKEGTSYTNRYARSENGLTIETYPGLAPKAPDPKQMHHFAVWLQSPSKIEFRVKDDVVTDVEGTLLGKKVAGGEDMVGKCVDFFGALAERAMNKAFEIAMEAAHLAKQILPNIGRMPFAGLMTGRTRAFAMAAGKTAPTMPQVTLAVAQFDAPGLGLGGKSRARKIVQPHQSENVIQTRQTEDETSS